MAKREAGAGRVPGTEAPLSGATGVAGRSRNAIRIAGKTRHAAISHPEATATADAPNPQRQPAATVIAPARYPLTAFALISAPSYMLPRRVRWVGGPACIR